MENNLKDQHYKNMGIMLQMETLTFQAESVAYVVCNALGLDTAEYSFPYLTSWSQEHTPKELKSSLFLVRKTADSIINQLIIQLEPEQHMTTIE